MIKILKSIPSTDPSTEIPETSEIPKITEPLSDADITIPSVLVGEELAQVQTEIATTDNGDADSLTTEPSESLI